MKVGTSLLLLVLYAWCCACVKANAWNANNVVRTDAELAMRMRIRNDALPALRDRFRWPFANWSIWNLPIGADAVYVPAGIVRAESVAMTVDPDVIILHPTAPQVDIVKTSPNGCWNGPCRCNYTTEVLYSKVPIPENYTLIDLYNNCAAAILLSDMNTIYQTQAFSRCSAYGSAGSQFTFPTVKIDGDGIKGAHGGSGMSSIGGTIRIGEWVPGAPLMRHALKVNLYGLYNFYREPGFRFPAVTRDSCASTCYNGSNPALTMGSLLAIPTSFNLFSMGFETEPGLMLAWTFQNYGGYVVDNTGWNVYAVETEQGPDGFVTDEFLQWGIGPIYSHNKTTPFARDMDRIFLNLAVVDNWNQTLYEQVIASDGAEGAGGGKPLQLWAPPFEPLPNN